MTPRCRRRYELVPVTRAQARCFVAQHHRHAGPPRVELIRVGLATGGELRGIATASRPIAQALDDGVTAEVSRVCVLEGERNATSALLGAICRALAALGYRRAISYTLASESGASLLAAGWEPVAAVEPRDWQLRSGRQQALFGPVTQPAWRLRWELALQDRGTPAGDRREQLEQLRRRAGGRG